MSFTPSPAELALVDQIFAKADPHKTGILPGDAALDVFKDTKLPLTVLADIWNIVDDNDNGWLTRKGVAIAVRLMGWAQKGEEITSALIDRRKCKSNLANSIHLLIISYCKLALCRRSKEFTCLCHSRARGSYRPCLHLLIYLR